MRVLIVPDKFKGTLTAQQAAEAMARGWRSARPEDELELVPMSDGGDGFGEILARQVKASVRHTAVVNAAHEPVNGDWWWSPATQTAIVESARVIGLAMLPPGKFHPFVLDTFGLGQMLREISRKHPEASLLIGIGGSATNDAGFGMARALGFRFEDANGYSVRQWVDLTRLDHVLPPSEPIDFAGVTVACDVQNPLLGPEGASRIYGPQKGLRPEDFSLADRCFERLVEIVARDLGMRCEAEPGTGAAGGLGYGLRAFLRGTFRPGFEIFAQAARLSERMNSADLVITGEGAIDRQTLMGKGTGAVAQMARERGKPCLGLAGGVADKSDLGPFHRLQGIVPDLTDLAEAKRNPAQWLSALAKRAAEATSTGPSGNR